MNNNTLLIILIIAIWLINGIVSIFNKKVDMDAAFRMTFLIGLGYLMLKGLIK